MIHRPLLFKLLFLIVCGTFIVQRVNNVNDDVLSLNNSKLGDFVDRIPSIGLEITNTTAIRFVSYIAVHLEINIEGGLRRKLYDKRNYLNFPIVTFPFICSSTAYGVLSLSLSDIPELVVHVMISLIDNKGNNKITEHRAIF